MEMVIGIVCLVLLFVYPKPILKIIGFFLLGFMVGLKGINPTKWFD